MKNIAPALNHTQSAGKVALEKQVDLFSNIVKRLKTHLDNSQRYLQQQADKAESAPVHASHESEPNIGELAHRAKAPGPDKVYQQVAKVTHALSEIAAKDSNHIGESLTWHVLDAKKEIELLAGRVSFLKDKKVQDELEGRLSEIKSHLEQVFSGLQYFDRVTQRLQHIARFAHTIHDIEGTGLSEEGDESSNSMLLLLRSMLSLADEKAVMDAIRSGASIKEALAIVEQNDGNDNNDIELF
jgi:hypothetical protein